jgi:hypothetical protein
LSRLKALAGVVGLVILLAPAAATAADVDAVAITLLGGRPDVRDGEVYTVVPIYELVALNARGLELGPIADVKVVVSLWGRLDPADPADGDLADGDLDLGYVEGGLAKGRLRLRLGRQLVFSGATRAAGLDGLFLEGRQGAFGLSAYGGVPVTPRFGVDRGEAMWGARLSLRRSVDAELGLSYAHALDEGRVSRFDLGADGRLVLSRQLTLTALGLLSAAEMRLAEARVTAAYQARKDLFLDVELSQTAPDLFLSRASILSVFSEESRTEAGAVVSYRPLHELRLRGAYHLLGNEAGLGHRGEVGAEATVAPGAAVGGEAGALQLDEDGYLHARLYVRAEPQRHLGCSFDTDLYRLDEPRHGTRLSARVAATVRWDPAPRWRLVLTTMAGSDPLYETRWEAMAKVAFAFERRGAR